MFVFFYLYMLGKRRHVFFFIYITPSHDPKQYYISCSWGNKAKAYVCVVRVYVTETYVYFRPTHEAAAC